MHLCHFKAGLFLVQNRNWSLAEFRSIQNEALAENVISFELNQEHIGYETIKSSSTRFFELFLERIMR